MFDLKARGYTLNAERLTTVINMIRDEENVFTMNAFSVDIADLGDEDWAIDGALQDPNDRELAERVLASGAFDPVCGTPACICGWINHARALASGSKIERGDKYGDQCAAADWIGIPISDTALALRASETVPAYQLFMTYGSSLPSARERVTREMAIWQLEQMRDTGIMHTWEEVIERFKALGHG
ncbi:hypothetical protein EVB87_180 [Rhizobium phage RHph_N28_1]|nr:hypothetical protein EVB87_180 [Rhizobium phage RHph_N28_1]QIG74209.1 hypothetical protein EVC07_181 [Rhizobium phage RHph_N42]QXV73868.1 hypothetical protein [Rhizobium phage RHph_N46]